MRNGINIATLNRDITHREWGGFCIHIQRFVRKEKYRAVGGWVTLYRKKFERLYIFTNG